MDTAHWTSLENHCLRVSSPFEGPTRHLGREIYSLRSILGRFLSLSAHKCLARCGGRPKPNGPKIYVVQTATEAIKRCILMATDPGDLVLDPTCGSGTTAYVAEQWGRRWITIDTSRVALALARARIMGARYPYYLLSDSRGGQLKEAEIASRAPADSPTYNDIRQGFVYERVPHIMLKSIANNAEIDVIWEKWQEVLEPLRAELNASLNRDWEEWEIPREPGDPWSATATAAWSKFQAAAHERSKVGGALRVEPGVGPGLRTG